MSHTLFKGSRLFGTKVLMKEERQLLSQDLTPEFLNQMV